MKIPAFFFNLNNLAFLKSKKNIFDGSEIKIEVKIKERKEINLLNLLNKYDKGVNVNRFFDLLKKMLKFDYKKRITVEDALSHDFFKGLNK